ncbi:polysaccharide deacetylase family protein [Natrialbaceae archaeon AArc-T1-2]|uniref:polysaccharide deacetylase family protein n=1 Tax=Natrialbaceae archaeon AArc-T1-2 TaxID=3053904 RepID=UPI00255ACE00|nr:polysaccharide deacetylase family protein [Natrialbaceae archaeon AArc-T1-2]WIV68555.1 polysaccharide deacetylase family protein [Natrialbaceae archaeon AArc-T1-2]
MSSPDRDEENERSQTNRSDNDNKSEEGTESEKPKETEESEDSNGMVVFTYDDSPIEDYTQTFSIHQEYEVPGNAAVNPGQMGSSDSYLTPDQLEEMVDAGWDVLSHTYKHRALGKIRLDQSLEPGDERVYVDRNRHGRFDEDPLVIFDEENRIATEVAGRGSNDTGEFIELTNSVSTYISDTGYTKYPEWKIQEVLEKTDTQLAEWGFDVSGFVYPYGRYDGVAEEIVRDHYDAVVNHRWGGGLNEIEGLDPTTMRRMYIEEDAASEEDIEVFLDKAVENDVLAIFGAHSQYETMTEERTRFTIESVLARDLEITTLSEAMTRIN